MVLGKHPGAGMSPGSQNPEGACVRRLLYTVAVVAALAPLAAIAPASAAVQHPAAADATCTGGWPVSTVANFSANNLNDPVGYWQDSSSVIVDSTSESSATEFCIVRLVPGGGQYAFREKGTSDCAVFTRSLNVVEIGGCDYDSTNQQWQQPSGNQSPMWPVSANTRCLDGEANNTDVYMNTCATAPDNQYWYFTHPAPAS